MPEILWRLKIVLSGLLTSGSKRSALHPCTMLQVYLMHLFMVHDSFIHHAYMTQCQDDFRNLSGRVLKILTAGRILQISIAWCQIEAEIHSFPTMYGKGGG